MNAKKCPVFASFLLAILLSGHAVAHEMHHDHSEPVASMPAIQRADLVPVAARYELKVNKSQTKTQTDWYLWRDADSVEMASVAVAVTLAPLGLRRGDARALLADRRSA